MESDFSIIEQLLMWICRNAELLVQLGILVVACIALGTYKKDFKLSKKYDLIKEFNSNFTELAKLEVASRHFATRLIKSIREKSDPTKPVIEDTDSLIQEISRFNHLLNDLTSFIAQSLPLYTFWIKLIPSVESAFDEMEVHIEEFQAEAINFVSEISKYKLNRLLGSGNEDKLKDIVARLERMQMVGTTVHNSISHMMGVLGKEVKALF
ncbi:MAG: hypothetical protein AB7J46_04835 [Candidatus Altimarinota bacterium]